MILSLKSGKKLKTDILLWANGRTGNTDDLGLENIGLTADSRGQIHVDETYRTSLPHIYAVGDVIGFPCWLVRLTCRVGRRGCTFWAINGGGAIAELIRRGFIRVRNLSSIGPTERELTAAGVPYEVGHAQFRSLCGHRSLGRRWGC